ncbi:hypothetical protein [Bosea sp. AAP35]|uniref:hypothetical protein n=1 Tax=Bosea sp. AAP35 TaxID=1523417 RepID=UPI000A5009FD|nr:hypothetical protein [Bosea sp. AAP35]
MTSIDPEPEAEPRRSTHGPGRRVLKMLVGIDSARLLRTRIGAALALVGLLAAFAVIGYGVPALLSQYF